MNSVLAISICAVILAAIVATIYGYYCDVRRLEEKRREWARLKEVLEDEIRNGHNIARITALRLRVRKLEYDLSRW